MDAERVVLADTDAHSVGAASVGVAVSLAVTRPLREPEADAQGIVEGESDCEPHVVSDTVAHGETVPDVETLVVMDTLTHPEVL